MKYVNKDSVKQMDFSEVNMLKTGDKIAICIRDDSFEDGKAFFPATVTAPLFYNSDADEPDWELETSNGYVDVSSVYRIIEPEFQEPEYDIVKELDNIQSRMHNTDMESDRIILKDAASMLLHYKKIYKEGVNVLRNGTDESDYIYCPVCHNPVATNEEDLRPGFCPDCGAKLIY